MNETKKNRHIGLKIWYVVAIALSVLLLITSAIGVIGTWAFERTLSNAVVAGLGSVRDMAGGLRQVGGRVNESAGQVKQFTTNVSDTASKISQNVNDQGLLQALLPPEQEQKLVEQAQQIQDTFNSIKDVLASAVSMYKSINELPFINLPTATTEQVTKLENSINQIQSTVAELRQRVQEFRSNAAGKIDVVSQAADKATKAITDLQNKLNKLDQDLAALQAKAERLQQLLPNLLILLAFLMTLFFAFLIYTQVEFILLFIHRWRELSQPSAALPPQTPIAAPATGESAG